MTGAKVPSILRGTSALGRSFGSRGGASHWPGIALGRAGVTMVLEAQSPKPQRQPPAPSVPTTKAVADQLPTPPTPTAKATKARPADKDGESQPPPTVLSPHLSTTQGAPRGNLKLCLLPQLRESMWQSPPGAPGEPSTGNDPEPHVPQAEDARASSVVATTGSGTLLPCQALAIVNCGTFLRCGALADARSMLDRLGVDLQEAEVRLANEHLRLAAGWRQLNTTAQEKHARADAAIMESMEVAAWAKAALESSLAEVGAATKRCEEAEAGLKALQDKRTAQAQLLQLWEDNLKARETKLADRDSGLAKVAAE